MTKDTSSERDLFKGEVEKIQTLIRALEDESVPSVALIMAQQALGTAANKLEVLVVECKQHSWPTPTDDQPSIYDLWDCRDEYGGCDATDGCWVECDGVCEHGHPSWLLRLGLI